MRSLHGILRSLYSGIFRKITIAGTRKLDKGKARQAIGKSVMRVFESSGRKKNREMCRVLGRVCKANSRTSWEIESIEPVDSYHTEQHLPGAVMHNFLKFLSLAWKI